MSALRLFVKHHPWITASLVVILLVASYFRLWSLNDDFHFMGDQGRDALIVSRIFTQKDLVFVGPVMSVGNIYLGPFYYYFMLPFLLLTYPSPVGPVYAVALTNIATVALLYVVGRKLVSDRAALLAAAFMAISVVSITNSRFSWNPNIIPCVALLMVFCSFFAWKRNPLYWVAVGACFGVIIQLHYVTLLSGLAAGLLLLWQLFEQRKNKKMLRKIVLSALGGIGVAILLLSPLMLFDSKHHWVNVKAFKSVFSDEKNFVQTSSSPVEHLMKVAGKIKNTSSLIIFDKTIGEHSPLNIVLVVAIVVICGWYIKEHARKKSDYQGLVVLLLFLVVGIIGFSFYEKDIYDHYIAYLLPIVFLVVGFCLDYLIQKHVLGWIAVAAFAYVYIPYNLQRVEFRAGGPTQQDLQVTAESIWSRVNDHEPYAIVLLSESKDLYGMNYRYFLNTDLDKRPVDPEQNSQADKLFIINEEHQTDQPQLLPIYEIVTFPSKEPAEVYTLPQGVTITVLENHSSSTP